MLGSQRTIPAPPVDSKSRDLCRSPSEDRSVGFEGAAIDQDRSAETVKEEGRMC